MGTSTHYLYEIEDTGELIVTPIPVYNGVSLHERVHFFGTKEQCDKRRNTLKKKRK
jgi:hypothetical protein